MKGSFGWKRVIDGRKVEIEAERGLDRQWTFYRRYGRNLPRVRFEAPLEEWLELLDVVKRRVGRRLMKPKDVEAIEEAIMLRFHQEDVPPSD